MKKIKLTQGKYAIVDDEDYPYLSRFHWVLVGNKSNGYDAVRVFLVNGNISIHISMYKFIIKGENNKQIIHLNRNTLDNRKENIALVPIYMRNHFNGKRTKNDLRGIPTSIYKGVSFSRKHLGKKNWYGCIQKNKIAYRKSFYTEKEAGLWYNEKARELYGEYAYQNKIE